MDADQPGQRMFIDSPHNVTIASPPPVGGIPVELVFAVTLVVLAFGFGAGAMWLHSRASMLRATSPALAAGLDQLGGALDALKGAVDAATPPSATIVSGLVQQAAESFFHVHTVALGAPHPSDPRAP